MSNRIPGQSGRKLTASGERRARTFEERGFTGLDDPGRRGRPREAASLLALKSGKPERTVRRQLAVGRLLFTTLGLDPRELVGTSLNKQAEMRALCDMPAEEALQIVAAAKRGNAVSATKMLKLRRTAEEVVQDEVNALIRLYNRTSPDGQRKFVSLFNASIQRDDSG